MGKGNGGTDRAESGIRCSVDGNVDGARNGVFGGSLVGFEGDGIEGIGSDVIKFGFGIVGAHVDGNIAVENAAAGRDVESNSRRINGTAVF